LKCFLVTFDIGIKSRPRLADAIETPLITLDISDLVDGAFSSFSYTFHRAPINGVLGLITVVLLAFVSILL
jgi:hypothetical protein